MITFSKIGSFGRLGNQLFQIAAAIGLARKNNDIAKFVPWKYSEYFKNPIDQNLIASEISSIIHERSFNYSPLLYRKNSDLIGYFQSEKYFENCKDLIRYHFEFNESLLIDNFIPNSDRSCSIHIRRGDYLNLQDYHPFPGMEYYKKSINYMRDHGVENFFLFSDDIPWCKHQFSNENGINYIEGNIDIKDLALMSSCKNNIIANSSFSWWGAWLNLNENKIIVAPSKWFGPAKIGVITDDLYCKDWIKM
jgi:hypothetical protein